MKDSEKIKMILNIGGCQLPVTVPFSQQEFVRDVEKQVNNLYSAWRHEFTQKKDQEVMTMVAYQFASYYAELEKRYRQASEKASRLLDSLDRDPETENTMI